MPIQGNRKQICFTILILSVYCQDRGHPSTSKHNKLGDKILNTLKHTGKSINQDIFFVERRCSLINICFTDYSTALPREAIKK